MTDRYLPVLSVGVGSHVAPMWPRVDPVPSGRGRLRRSGPARPPGPARPAGRGKANVSLHRPLLPKPDRGRSSPARMRNDAGRGCFGVARGCPLGTDHDRCEWHGSGTARGQPWYACRCWVHLDHRVRAVRGNHGCMGKPLQTARQLFPMPSGRGRMGRWLRRPASMPAELGSSRLGAREDLLAAFLGVRD